MEISMKKKSGKHVLIYCLLIILAILIIVPVGWVFMASLKQNHEFYETPWKLPSGFYVQNFIDAWGSAHMGQYMLNSVIVTAVAIVLLLMLALPASYCLSRFQFKMKKVIQILSFYFSYQSV